jgi:hypothetical protein
MLASTTLLGELTGGADGGWAAAVVEVVEGRSLVATDRLLR